MQSAIDLALAFASRLRVDETVRFIGSKLVQKIYPQDTRNGKIFVVAEVLVLLANLAIGKRST